MAISRTTATLPVVDLARAKKFYQEKLGFRVEKEDPSPGANLRSPDCDCFIYLYQRAPTKADHTVVGITVDDVEETMRELKSKGVKFEEYDMPNLKTVNGIFKMDGYRSAWFKDTEGNILAITNM
jgi:predicted enzyme related to lactoylglutathione lyase